MSTQWAKIFSELNTIANQMGDSCPESILIARDYSRKMRDKESLVNFKAAMAAIEAHIDFGRRVSRAENELRL